MKTLALYEYARRNTVTVWYGNSMDSPQHEYTNVSAGSVRRIKRLKQYLRNRKYNAQFSTSVYGSPRIAE